jgi:hypothetical protein
MSMVEVYTGKNLNRVNAFYLILKYHALQFGRDLKIFNEDNTAVIFRKFLSNFAELYQRSGIFAQEYIV